MPDDGLFVVDTSDLFAGLEGAGTGDRRALGRMCNLIQIPTNNLHNAGNDAYVRVYLISLREQLTDFVLVYAGSYDGNGWR